VRLGDPRTKVHEFLGAPDDPTLGFKEAYPASGVEAWFDAESRVTKLSFYGEASALYQAYSVQIPSDRVLILGLTPHTSEEGFLRALGSSVQQNEGGRPRCTRTALRLENQGTLD
jgi:hypothetical protein